MPDQSKVYGVSYGNGNDGVSQIHADFYVKTNDPWKLAKAAVIDHFSTIKRRNYVQKNMMVDGDAEYTISAMILDPADNPGWSEANGAWFICEVFPIPEEELSGKKYLNGRRVYRSINEAISSATMRRLRKG